jgi:hypothetical protein
LFFLNHLENVHCGKKLINKYDEKNSIFGGINGTDQAQVDFLSTQEEELKRP